MATTFTEAKAQLDSIALRSEANRARLLQAQTVVSQALTDLTSMQTAYTAFKADLDALAASSPTLPSVVAQQAQMNQMIVDFNDLKTRAQNMVNALTGL